MNVFLKGLFGSLIFSQCLLNSSFAAISDEFSHVSITEDVQTQQLKTAKKVAQVASRILSTPEEHMTFENTLGLWQRLIEEISANADGITNQGIGAAFSAEMQCSPEFYLALKRNALLILSEESSNVFQKHIARCFLDNCEQKGQQYLLYLNGRAEEKNSIQNEFTIMDLAIGDISKDQIIALTEQILDSNADILCLREISVEDSSSLFDSLKNDYAHIYVAANVCGKEFSSSSPWINGSIFVASKYVLENVKIRSLQSSTENELLDFVIKGSENYLGHIYSVALHQGYLEEGCIEQLEKLIQVMQGDFLEIIETEEIPFFVCGDLGNSEQDKALISSYFRSDNRSNGRALLLQSLPAFPREKVGQEYKIATAAFLMHGWTGLFARIQEETNHSLAELVSKNLRGRYRGGNEIMLCGRADVSYDRDTEGNSQLDVSVSGTKETDYGDFSVDVHGGASQDKGGDTSGHAGVDISWEF